MTVYANYQAAECDRHRDLGRKIPEGLSELPRRAPTSPISPANAYYQQIPDISRDQDVADKAMTAFQEIVKKYPNSEYVEDSKFKITVCQDQLAGKEMSIGRFYLNRQQLYRGDQPVPQRPANITRPRVTRRRRSIAWSRPTWASASPTRRRRRPRSSATTSPTAQWYKDAFSLLQSKGLSPQENSDSWISKIYHAVVPS